MKPSAKTRSLVAYAVISGAVWSVSCNGGNQITATPSQGGSQKGGIGGSSHSGNADPASGSGALSGSNDANIQSDGGVQTANGAGGSIGTKVGGSVTSAPTPIAYPLLDLTGAGVTTCEGSFYPTNAKFTSQMDDAKLTLNLYAASITADSDKVTKQANDKIQQSIGTSVYTRVTADQRTQLKAQGFDYADYAIFATTVTKDRQGQTFTFDKPLPVFPWPAPASRYDDLVAAGQKSWTANVTGSINSSVTVTIQKVGGDATTQIIKFTTTIAADTDRSMYEQFPLPRETTFTVNSDTKDVRQIDQLSWYFGKDNCSGGEEQVTLSYKLCTKTLSGQATNYPCQ